MGRRVDELDLDPGLREALSEPSPSPDQVVPVGSRVMVLNTLPISSGGLRIGSVTTLRDRTELLALQHELDHCQGLLFLDRVAGAHALYARKVYLDAPDETGPS